MSIDQIAIENVEAVLRGEITEPSPGTLAARVLAWADQRDAWLRAAAQSAVEMSDGLEFYRGIVWKIGDMFGVSARTSDDGSIQDQVLALKVPELVESALRGPVVTVTVGELDVGPL